MKKVLKIVLILAVILLALGIAAFHYIKSVMPSGNGNNDIVEGYYKKFHSVMSWKKVFSVRNALYRFNREALNRFRPHYRGQGQGQGQGQRGPANGGNRR